MKDAVQVAVSNSLSRKKTRLWKKNPREYDDSQVSYSEIEALRKTLKKNVPWTPWRKKGGEKRG